MQDAIHILGARGSVPVCDPPFARYGGQTTCFVLRLNGEAVILDAGSGMMELDRCLTPGENRASLLLTHPHADHLLGLPLCPAVLRPDFRLDVYAAARGGLSPEEQVSALLSPPLWPVDPSGLPADIRFHALPEALELGSLTVRSMEGCHPGGVSLLRISGSGKSVVLVTDCTLSEALLPRLTEFASGCDVLLCDGQYTDAEWETRAGFGHSTCRAAAALGKACGARKTVIIHHDPGHTDEMLDAAQAALKAEYPNCTFARAGEEVEL